MPGKTLKQQVTEMREDLFTQGLLDEFFTILENLADDENPNFAEDTVNVFFNESARVIATVEQHLAKDPVDLNTIYRELHKIKGGGSSIGAATIARKVEEAWAYCGEGNLESFKGCFNELKEEVDTMKGKLEIYFQLLKQAAAGN